MKRFIIAILVALAAPAKASDPADTEQASAALARSQAELRRAQSELDALSTRIAELSMKIAREDIEAALARPAFDRPVIGVVLRSDPTAGAALAAVTPNSPAQRAGLRSGDRITAVDGRRIPAGSAQQRLQHARELLDGLEAGQTLRVDYQRGGESGRVDVTAEQLPGLSWWRGRALDADAIRAQIEPMIAMRQLFALEQIAPFPPCDQEDDGCPELALAESLRWRSLRLAPLDAQLGRYFGSERGVLVLSAEASPLKGLQSGDVLLEIEGTPVEQPGDVIRALRGSAPDSRLQVRLMRDRKPHALELEAAALPRFRGFAPPLPPSPPTPPAAPAPRALPQPASAPTPAAAPPPPPPPPPPRGVLQQILY
jgi:hypothetical protein